MSTRLLSNPLMDSRALIIFTMDTYHTIVYIISRRNFSMREFIDLTSIEDINHFISTNPIVLLYISLPNCTVCHGLFPQVKHLMAKYPKIQLGHIDAAEVQEIAGQFSIFTAPVLLLLIDGKEYVREARIVHMDLLEEKLDKLYKNVVG